MSQPSSPAADTDKALALDRLRTMVRYENTMERAGDLLFRLLRDVEAKHGPLPSLTRDEILRTHAALIYPAAVYLHTLEEIVAGRMQRPVAPTGAAA